MSTADGSGRRAANRRRTIAAIEEAAIDLIERDGYAATTSEHIAAAAGVSPRTFFRYCPTKIDALLSVTTELEDDITAAVEELPSPRTLPDLEQAITTALVRAETERPTSLDRLRRLRPLLASDDALRDALLARDARHVLDLEARWGGTGARPGFVVPVALLALRSAIDVWAADESRGALPEAFATMMTRLRSTVAAAPGRSSG